MKRYTIYVFFIFLTQQTVAQTDNLVRGEFTGISFDQFVAQVEMQTGYHFYYNPAWTDTLKVTLSSQGRTAEEILGELFANTALHYTINVDKTILITYERELLTALPQDYFNVMKTEGVQPAFDYSDYKTKENQRKMAVTKLYVIGSRSNHTVGNPIISGTIREESTGEPVIGASVYVESPLIGVATDQFGYYSLTLPRGSYVLHIKSLGMKATQRNVVLHSNGRLDIELEEEMTPLKEVVIESEKDVRVSGVQMGVEKLDIKTMKQLPLVLGETDIMKVVLTLPGVQSVGEGTVGLNVRGGANNQNLILFNDAVVYNPSHLFGFFSSFNPDILRNVELNKSSITADYGGRLSSVLNVTTRDGNAKKISGSGGISPVTGRFSLEGPIQKDRTSFIMGMRSTYSDWLLRQLESPALRNSRASFQDVTTTVTHKFDNDNHVYLSTYLSKDGFTLNNDTTYQYSDRNASLKWKHVFNPKFFGLVVGSYSHYKFDVASAINPVNAFKMDFAIQQLSAKTDFTYIFNQRHTFNAGVSAIRYAISPGSIKPEGNESLITSTGLPKEQGRELAAYISDNIEISRNISIYLGLRYATYQYLGPRDVFQYASGVSREVSSIIDTLRFNKGKAIKTYRGAEPRFSMRYSVSQNASVKVSYVRMQQFIQMLSNTTAITPIDSWKLSDSHIRPQIGDQVSVGFFKNIRKNQIELSLEAYYKSMSRTIDYKNGASLLFNAALETDVIDARGKAYGVEFMIKKSSGKLNGWINYTFSRSVLQSSGFASELVNRGEFYPSNFDKPHAANLIGNYKFSRRFSFSLNVVYSTGRPITLPIAKYDAHGAMRVFYSDRNAFRIPDYFRTDVSVNFEGNHKVRKLAHSSWTLSVYNLLSRANAYSVFFRTEDGKVNGYQLSIFARAIPTLAYNFKF